MSSWPLELMSRWIDLATTADRSTRVNSAARANTSRCIDFAARAKHLDELTRPSEPGSLDGSIWPQELTYLD